ncbi:PREDICTED: mitochondrial genome maintenance exonuclease 1-like [Polistes canadensis]|uniref:mitochondrial genome maintenance exonuclease 1-like n=1 Tax=Polistes canadensis TaxID=91411 RepID=UPI000718B442|nr:PREDICTED: mitochondrial genome maintenance exonuclease 1-like [Polistes canadensis]
MKSLKILLCCHRCFIFPCNINTLIFNCNSNSANIFNGNRRNTKLHQKNREDKYMFGPMKRKKKETLTKSIVDLKKENVSMDSELWWNLKVNRSRMNLIRFTSQTHINTIASMKCNKSYAKNLLLDCNENNVASKSKESNIKSKKSKDIRRRKNITDKKCSSNNKDNSKNNKDDSKNNKDDTKNNKDDRKNNKDDTKNNKDDSVSTKTIPNELEAPQPKNEKLVDVHIIKSSRFPIFTEQQKIPKALKQSEVLSLSLKDDPEILYYPSVTKILSETMSPEAQKLLNLWKNKLIKEMGEEKFNEYQQELLNNGKIFHSCIEDTLYGREVDIPEHILPAYNSLSSIINELEDIKAVESFVSHKGLCYKGKVDCIATYRGKLCVIDWKKSDKDKKKLNLTYDAPIQLAAYVGAINSSKSYPFSIHYAMIVVGYTTGKPADIFFLSDHHLNEHWYRWLAKLKNYWHNVKNQNNCSD